jgi:hypothetical protein
MKTVLSNQDNKKRICDRILKRVRGSGRGTVFTWKDFADFGTAAAVRQALSRLVKRGKIRRVARGIYDFPRTITSLGIEVAPSADAVALAVARADGAKLQISGAQAANALGLSTQVPARTVFLSDGPSHHIRIGQQSIELRHAPPVQMVGAGKISGLVVSALSHLGPSDVHDADINRLQRLLSDDDKKQLRHVTKRTLPWMQPFLNRIIGHN